MLTSNARKLIKLEDDSIKSKRLKLDDFGCLPSLRLRKAGSANEENQTSVKEKEKKWFVSHV